MKHIVPLPSFERDIKKFRQEKKERLKNTLKDFNRFVATGEKPFGFRFKKINKNKYEFRIDIRLRVVTKLEGDTFYLVKAGDHNEIKRYLRKFRHK
ncbi:MAG: hypothetical protein SCARUB_03049 [Candidatus Scalindua rubra]|uniref:Type II toxin-antitoxin system mRNA interferase toxin, RelE/StbE family n=1 Tax=Candidatus Scalindua rubra TaxID=1872076 RepID=A0A1E3X879_9BACT|nr:MAG: hypothetical protein SCARUB_03049 [Candidatus Scalindua rubra]